MRCSKLLHRLNTWSVMFMGTLLASPPPQQLAACVREKERVIIIFFSRE